MIELPVKLNTFMQGQDLTGLKPFALLYRNKWDSANNVYALDMANPIDITAMIVKPNTLSMTLDVNEIAQYNANNVTLTLSDVSNIFMEGTPSTLFPPGYQMYGSKVVLYYGLDNPINPYPTQVGYTVVGSPIIVDGVVSNFSLSSYVQIPAFMPGNKTWDLQLKFKLNSSMTNSSALFNDTSNDFRCPKVSVIPGTSSVVFRAFVSTTGSSWNVSSGPQTSVSFDYSKWAYILWEFTGSQYILSFKQEGQNYRIIRTINSTKPFYQNQNQVGMSFGNDIGSAAQYNSYIDGSIDLNETYIKVNGQMWFNGAAFFYNPAVTPLFTGVIKEPPTHKPEKYQLDLKLVSPLEMLKDIEAKDFSDKVTGEVLTLDHTGDNNEEFYLTVQKGVGGITALYANGVKLYEGVDYEVSDLNKLNYNAVIEVKNSTVFGQTFTVDYYYWKRSLSIEDIVSGVVALGGYSGATTDIQPVSWQNAVRSPSTVSNVLGAIGYYESALNEYTFNWHNRYGNSWQNTQGTGGITNKLPTNFDYYFTGKDGRTSDIYGISLGDEYNSTTISYSVSGITYNLGPIGVKNGIAIKFNKYQLGLSYRVGIYSVSNSTVTLLYEDTLTGVNYDPVIDYGVQRRGNTVDIYYKGNKVATATITGSMDYHYQYSDPGSNSYVRFTDQTWNFYDNNLVLHGANLTQPCIVTTTLDMTAGGSSWGAVEAELDQDAIYFLNAYFSTDTGATWSGVYSYNIDVNMARPERYLYYVLGVPDNQASFDIKDPSTYFYASTLVLNIVNLGNSTVLEALQDLALISGYEFGVDRQGVFFFRPRVASTNPVYELGHNEVAKVDTVKKNFSDFFTKLTLTFAQVPLEFYANTGTRPTPIDKYGVINKEIDKPDIVNYDNPELAQAIGPQLLEVYSSMPNIIQVTGKLNLALELADIVNLKRNYNLVEPDSAQDYLKYLTQGTYYRACKITGLNYNFSKRQITYTLRDVSNENNMPTIDAKGFVYELPIELGKLN